MKHQHVPSLNIALGNSLSLSPRSPDRCESILLFIEMRVGHVCCCRFKGNIPPRPLSFSLFLPVLINVDPRDLAREMAF